MRYNGMPAGMWIIFNKQFRNSLMTDLGYDMASAKRITDSAKQKYRSIIEKLRVHFINAYRSFFVFLSIRLSSYAHAERLPSFQPSACFLSPMNRL